MSLYRKLALLSLVFIGAHPLSANSADSNQAVDYASIMARGFGISDEPSIFNQCEPDYEGFRIVELAGGRPLAIIRIENRSFLRRTFARGASKSTTESTVADGDWALLVDLLGQSGFWTYKNDNNGWMPDSATLWIEACVNSEFRSVWIYPDRDNRMNEIMEFLVSIQP